MSITFQERLKQTIETAGKSENDLLPEEARAVFTKTLGLFRLRLQTPYYYQIYTPITLIGKVLAERFPVTGTKINSILQDLIREEPETLKLFPPWGINVLDPPNEKESSLLARLSGMKGEDQSGLKKAISDFLELA